MSKCMIIGILLLIPFQAMALGNPTVQELLNKYAATQDRLNSFIIKSESWGDSDSSFFNADKAPVNPHTKSDLTEIEPIFAHNCGEGSIMKFTLPEISLITEAGCGTIKLFISMIETHIIRVGFPASLL